MKMVYSNKIDDEIITHEKNMLAFYLKKVEKYIPLFEERGYSLKVGLMWNYYPGDILVLQRGCFQNGYQCYVYCAVQKDGNEVHIRSIDDEADYYSLSRAWMVSSIFRKCFKLNVELYTNTDDVDADLNDFLSQLKHQDKYIKC